MELENPPPLSNYWTQQQLNAEPVLVAGTRGHETGEISTTNNTLYLPTPLDTPTLPTLDTLPLLHLINVYLLGPP